MKLLLGLAFSVAGIGADAQEGSGLQRAFDEAVRVRRVADSFAAKHPADGQQALHYFRSLTQRGFICAARRFDEVVAREGSELGQFRIKESAIVDCARVPSGFVECARFRVTARTDTGPKDGLKQYVAGLANAKITTSYFVCESTRTEGAKHFESDVKSGAAVVVR